MSLLIPWKWNADSTYTNKYKLETSLTDFDEPYVSKNVYGIQLNTITEGDIPATFRVYWRRNPKDSYTFWGNIVNSNNHMQEGVISYKKAKNQQINVNVFHDAEPIKDVTTFQVKIEATGWGDFAVNDINILFRPKRKWTATDVKTYIRAT